MGDDVVEPKTFSVVSGNVKVGGFEKASDSMAMRRLAELFSLGTVAGIQEVTHQRFSRSLEAHMKTLGNYQVQHIELPENDDKEEAAIAYNADIASLDDVCFFPDPKKYFRRKPAAGRLQIGHKTLILAVYHAEFGKGNKAEITKLPYALDYFRKVLECPNIIVTADTNLGSEGGGLVDPYFSNFGYFWPQAFPWPGVDTTNSGYTMTPWGKKTNKANTYDYIMWDGAQFIPRKSSIITFNETKQTLVDLMDKTYISYILPKVRQKVRREVTRISDHWFLKVDFYLDDDYSIRELLRMDGIDMIEFGAKRVLRSAFAQKYDFPDRFMGKLTNLSKLK